MDGKDFCNLQTANILKMHFFSFKKKKKSISSFSHLCVGLGRTLVYVSPLLLQIDKNYLKY